MTFDWTNGVEITHLDRFVIVTGKTAKGDAETRRWDPQTGTWARLVGGRRGRWVTG